MSFLRKLQSQPEQTRKIILWSIVVILGLGLAIWWVGSSYQKLKEFKKEEFIEKINLPDFKERIPGIEIPEISEEGLKKLKKETQN